MPSASSRQSLANMNAVIATLIACFALVSCSSIDTPKWLTSGGEGKYGVREYITGRGSAGLTGDFSLDRSTAIERARADLLGKLVVEVHADFVREIRESSSGDTIQIEREAAQRIQSTVRGSIPVETLVEEHVDQPASQIHVLVAVKRSNMLRGLKTRHDDAHSEMMAALGRVERSFKDGQHFDALRALHVACEQSTTAKLLRAEYAAINGGTSSGLAMSDDSSISVWRERIAEALPSKLDYSGPEGLRTGILAIAVSSLSAFGLVTQAEPTRYVLVLDVEENVTNGSIHGHVTHAVTYLWSMTWLDIVSSTTHAAISSAEWSDAPARAFVMGDTLKNAKTKASAVVLNQISEALESFLSTGQLRKEPQ